MLELELVLWKLHVKCVLSLTTVTDGRTQRYSQKLTVTESSVDTAANAFGNHTRMPSMESGSRSSTKALPTRNMVYNKDYPLIAKVQNWIFILHYETNERCSRFKCRLKRFFWARLTFSSYRSQNIEVHKVLHIGYYSRNQK